MSDTPGSDGHKATRSRSVLRHIGPMVVFTGVLPLYSYAVGRLFGNPWPPLSLASVALSFFVAAGHALYFVPIFLTIQAPRHTSLDRWKGVAAWTALGLMLSVAPLPDTIRYGVSGLRFNALATALYVSFFALIGVWHTRRGVEALRAR